MVDSADLRTKITIFAKKFEYNMLIGREKEKCILTDALTEEYSQFIAVLFSAIFSWDFISA